MGTLLEQTRAAHEEMERLERLATSELGKETKTHKERLLNNSRVRKMVDGICSRAAKLVSSFFVLARHLPATTGKKSGL